MMVFKFTAFATVLEEKLNWKVEWSPFQNDLSVFIECSGIDPVSKKCIESTAISTSRLATWTEFKVQNIKAKNPKLIT